jgi:hypothetical protein
MTEPPKADRNVILTQLRKITEYLRKNVWEKKITLDK